MLGYKPGQRVGHLCSDYMHPDDQNAVAQSWQHLVDHPEEAGDAMPVRLLHADGSWIDTEYTAQPIQDRNNQDAPSLLVSIRDVRVRKQAEIKLEQRLAFEQLVTDISSHFMALPTEQIDDGIQYALQRLGEFTGVDLCVLFQISDDRALYINTHEWSAPGIPSQGPLRQTLRTDANGGWWLNELTTKGLIYCLYMRLKPPPLGG